MVIGTNPSPLEKSEKAVNAYFVCCITDDVYDTACVHDWQPMDDLIQ